MPCRRGVHKAINRFYNGSVEQPILRLGLIGFPDNVTAQLVHWLSREVEGWPQWTIAPFDKADAWWINGRSIVDFDDKVLTLHTGRLDQDLIKINPTDSTRPIAFAGKLPSALEVEQQVDLRHDASMRQHLQNFEAWLRPLRAQFALGADLVERESELKPGVYQITLQGRLLAVIDLFKWRAGILPTARPVDFNQAAWDHRPPSASDIPSSFIQMTVSHLMWIYATRTRRDVLPQRYRKNKIYFRRLPRMPAGWLQDEHLLLVRELSIHASTLDGLVLRTGIAPVLLAQYMAALYFAGSITTNPRSAGEPLDKRTPLGMDASQPLQIHQGPDSQIGFGKMSGFTRDSRPFEHEQHSAPASLPQA